MAGGVGQSGGRPPVPVSVNGDKWPSISALARDVNMTRTAVRYAITKGGARSMAALEYRIAKWKERNREK